MEKFRKEFIDRDVRFTNAKLHKENPKCYPPILHIGTIVAVDDKWAVQWDRSSGVDEHGVKGLPYTWFCDEKDIQLIDDPDDEEIWKMVDSEYKNYGMQYFFDVQFHEEEVRDMVEYAYWCGYNKAYEALSSICKKNCL